MEMCVKGFIILMLLAALAALASADSTVANAEAGNHPALDLYLESTPVHPTAIGEFWTLTVHNHKNHGHPPVTARNVVVRTTLTVEGQELRGTDRNPTSKIDSGTTFDASTGLWTIPLLPPGGSAQVIFRPGGFMPDDYWLANNVLYSAQPTPFRLHAELVEPGKSGEWPPSPLNNETEGWYVLDERSIYWSNSAAGVPVSYTHLTLPTKRIV